MLKLALVLLFSHFVADFYFQSDHMCKEKARSFKMLLLHSCIYAVTVGISLLSTGLFAWWMSLSVALGLGVLHLVTDDLKVLIENKLSIRSKLGFQLFLADQVIHILFLVVFSILLKTFITLPAWLSGAPNIDRYVLIFKFMTAALICGKPAGILVKRLLECFDNVSQDDDNEDDEDNNARESASDGGGMMIGVLERETILLLTFLQQYAVIGFVLTAKSVARYKQLEKQAFAEKYLIGTLTSALISLLIGVMMCTF